MLDIVSKPSPNYSGNMGAKSVIVCHWWDKPEKKPTFEGTVGWLCNPASKVSAHYVVSGKRVAQLVDESNVAWHAMSANPFSIGIEVDPNTPAGTYETVIELCRAIATRHQMNRSTCVKAHRDYVNTTCPGTLDIERIRKGVMAQGGADDMTIEDYVSDVLDVIEDNPHYATQKPEAYKKHVAHVKGLPWDKRRSWFKGILANNGVLNATYMRQHLQDDERKLKEAQSQVKEVVREVPVKVEVPVEVIKEVPVEVPVEVIKEVPVPAENLSALELIRLGINKFLRGGGS